MDSDRFQKKQARWGTSLVWPAAGLALLLLFNFFFTEGFFKLEVRDGHLYGVLIDVLNHGSKVMLLSLGMALVIATSGVDLSVGAVMAIAGAVAAPLSNKAGVPFPLVIASALGVAVLAVWLSPTDSMNNPMAVRRVSTTVTSSIPRLNHTGNGSPSQWPLPMKTSFGSVNVMIWPSVMSIATPRPATIRINVATIGWMRNAPTSKPFQQPASIATANAAAMTSGKGTPARLIS